jgi:hypothetical protein
MSIDAQIILMALAFPLALLIAFTIIGYIVYSKQIKGFINAAHSLYHNVSRNLSAAIGRLFR